MWLARWGGSSNNGGVVTDRIALILAVLIAVLLSVDLLVNDGQVLLFLAKKIVDLAEYLIFWR